mgnify:CR=1 FL=1
MLQKTIIQLWDTLDGLLIRNLAPSVQYCLSEILESEDKPYQFITITCTSQFHFDKVQELLDGTDHWFKGCIRDSRYLPLRELIPTHHINTVGGRQFVPGNLYVIRYYLAPEVNEKGFKDSKPESAYQEECDSPGERLDAIIKDELSKQVCGQKPHSVVVPDCDKVTGYPVNSLADVIRDATDDILKEEE